MSNDAMIEELAPPGRLMKELDDALLGEGQFVVSRLTSGMSNEIFRLSRSGRSWVLRRPPRVTSVPGAHDVVREHRILTALRYSGVPHAAPVHLCTDASVIGAPFFVMRDVAGVNLAEGLPPGLDTAASRTSIAHQLVDAMVRLHALDWQEAGLADLGRPEGFTARLVDRWMGQYSRYDEQRLPALEETAALLREQIPPMTRTSLIHADIGLHNALFSVSDPVRIDAIVDWETATIGDPMLDLGHFLTTWLTDPAEREQWFGARVAVDLSGFPPASALAERYATATGQDTTHLDWYRAVAQLRIAVILEGAYQRFRRGHGDSPSHQSLARRIPNVAERALAIARGQA